MQLDDDDQLDLFDSHRDELANRVDRYMRRTIITTTGCMLWTGSKDNEGYALVSHRHQHSGHLSRLVYERDNGPIPPGLLVMHRCDNPSCVNIKHLQLGTHRDNHLDAIEKGRKDMNALAHLSGIQKQLTAAQKERRRAQRAGQERLANQLAELCTILHATRAELHRIAHIKARPSRARSPHKQLDLID